MTKKNVNLDAIFESFYWNQPNESIEDFILTNITHRKLEKIVLSELLYFSHIYRMDKLSAYLLAKGADKAVIGSGIKSLGYCKFISENPNIPYSSCYSIAANYIVRCLVDRLGIYAKLPPVISFVGSNGKGSTLNFIKYLLTEAGYVVHAYTKPHVIRTNEEMVVANKEIEDAVLYKNLCTAKKVYDTLFQDPDFIRELKNKLELDKERGYVNLNFARLRSSWFKFPAFLLACADSHADFLLLEAHCGGEFDVTNVFNKHDTVITKVFYSYDHRDMLGKNITEMASTKARIVSPNSCVIIAQQDPEVFDIIKSTVTEAKPANIFAQNHGDWGIKKISNNKYSFAGFGSTLTIKPPKQLLGEHQLTNAATAIAFLYAKGFRFSSALINRAIAKTTFLGRLQRLPTGLIKKYLPKGIEIILDWGKNSQGLKQTKIFLESQKKKYTYTIASIDTDEELVECFKTISSFSDKVINIPWIYTTYTKDVFRSVVKKKCLYYNSLSGALKFVSNDIKKQKLNPKKVRLLLTTTNTDSIGYLYVINGNIKKTSSKGDKIFAIQNEKNLDRHDFLYTYGHKTKIGYIE